MIISTGHYSKQFIDFLEKSFDSVEVGICYEKVQK